jgi:hypothetical protein
MKKTKRFFHVYGISNFRVELARGKRKCTECDKEIPKDSLCLKGYLIDKCAHYNYKKRKTFYVHKLVQLCVKCVEEGITTKLLDTYRGENRVREKTNKAVDDLKRYAKNPELYKKRKETLMSVQKSEDVSWVQPGVNVRIGQHVQSDLNFSRNEGASGSVIRLDGDYAVVYIPTNITKGMPPEERVPLAQCEHA